MITTIAEHSVDLDLLPPVANILDAGCRGFEFTKCFRERGHNVLAIDIDGFDMQEMKGEEYDRVGISTVAGIATIDVNVDRQALCIKDKIAHADAKTFCLLREGEVQIVTLEDLQKRAGVDKFDLIKLDIEGEEFEILSRSQHPLAKQISVEFHAHTGKQSKGALDALLTHLSVFYTIHGAVWESRHGAGYNYWSVLLISKT